ncbi:FUSC family protein [Litoribacter populi]|uniref:FUSC family protein n=1 Tax=Litoribacter populi TaxID=2598460 RepID=UPI00117DD0FB|nr:FUSC family membrane protein [Litoribacter populi]
MFYPAKRFFSQFIKDSDFLKALLTTFGMVLPLVVGISLGVLPYTLSMAIGVLLSAGSDVPGSKKHKNFGILIASSTVMMVNILISGAMVSQWLLIPVMIILTFLVSYISVYGFRASLISFAGLMTIVFSFAHPHYGLDILYHGGMFALGGLWYLLLSNIFHPLLEKRQTTNLLAACLKDTGRLVRLKGKLLLTGEMGEPLEKEMFDLQVKINEEHESLRAVLLSERQKSGTSNYKRKQLLILIELIDLLELTVASPVNHQKIKEIFTTHSEKLAPFQKIILQLSQRLSTAGSFMQKEGEILSQPDWEQMVGNCKSSIDEYVNQVGLPQAREGALLMHNLLDYIGKLIQKSQSMERVILDFGSDKQGLDPQSHHKFLTQQDYDIRILRENLNFDSPIFRHSARLTVAMLIGYAVGMIFPVQNAYWIILTVVVIMRPGYTLTKERSKQRLYGTLIGAVLAGIFVLFIGNVYLFAALSIISLVLALSFMQKNYKTSSIFITTGIVFLYVLIEPNAFEVIGHRIVDTITGAAISMFSILFIWPAWESSHIRTGILKALKANEHYLHQIKSLCEGKQDLTPYRLSRKEAFLAMGHLNAAFQRMSQEPKTRQLDGILVYKIVGLNHTLLAAAAALGTYIKDNRGNLTSISFLDAISSIQQNLIESIAILNNEEGSHVPERSHSIPDALQELENKYSDLSQTRDQQLQTDQRRPIAPEMLRELQSTRMIADQLNWMNNISQSLKSTIKNTVERDI